MESLLGSLLEPPACSSIASSEEPWPPVPLARLLLLRGSFSVTTVTSRPGSFRRTLADGESSDSPLRTSPSADCRLRGERELAGGVKRESRSLVSSLAEYSWWSTGQLDSAGETTVTDLSLLPVFSSFSLLPVFSSFSLLQRFSSFSLLPRFSSSLLHSFSSFSLLHSFSFSILPSFSSFSLLPSFSFSLFPSFSSFSLLHSLSFSLLPSFSLLHGSSSFTLCSGPGERLQPVGPSVCGFPLAGEEGVGEGTVLETVRFRVLPLVGSAVGEESL